ncbi:MAG: sigma-70 family RNA polymerase sigma factor [Rhodanobacteraceae bacterium]|nr:sigma-70 family RNA polymerase sigma factor [Rhodanobacteraceae bacterium]
MADFPSTQWHLVRGTALSQDDRRVAFGTLVEAYRPAILAYLRARVGVGEAEDLLQSFLASSYEHAWFARADPDFGSFRVFLLVMLKRHVAHWRERRSLTTESIDDESTALGDADANVDPERAFDARFLMTLTAQALAQLRKTYAARDRAALFDQLLPLLTSPPERGELAAIAARMEIPANTLAVELKRLRERVAGAMREQLAELCVDPITADRDWQALRLGRLP